MEKDLDIDKLEQLYKEGNQINPFFMDALYTVALNKLTRQRERAKQGEQEKQNEKVQEEQEETINTEEDFINFINKIDTYIASFTYDELMKKPDFFLDITDQNIKDYIEGRSKLLHFSDNSNSKIMDKKSDILTTKKKDIDILDEFSQKKMFYDINTTFISSEEIFTDNKQELIFKFQYLINKFFNKIVDSYIKEKGLGANDIIFMYKGGTFMKIIFEKYKNLFKNNENFINSNSSFFKRSDSDYAIYISHRFNREDYTLHYYNLNIMVYNVLNKIKQFINKNLNDVLPINKIDETQLKKQLGTLNEFLRDNRKTLPYFKEVEKFIGISLYNITHMDERLPDKFNLYTLDPKSLHYENIIKVGGKIVDKSALLKQHKKIPVQRNSFYVTPKKDTDDKYYSAVKNIDDSSLSGIYQYYNETNHFDSYDNSLLNYFTLHRIKINVVLYFKTWSGRYGFFQCPSELIDIPIPTIEDFKSNINFDQIIKSYKHTLYNKELIFNSYNIYGLIEDINKALFVELKFPWNGIKYEKKIHRLIFFLMIYLNNNYSNFNDIQAKLLNFIDSLDVIEAQNIKFNKYDGSVSDEDQLYKYIVNKINDINIKVISEGDHENIEKNKNMLDTVKSSINLFKYENISSGYTDIPENVPYLKKYLKYKNKYLVLKSHKDKG
jgi:hypothetical protein